MIKTAILHKSWQQINDDEKNTRFFGAILAAFHKCQKQDWIEIMNTAPYLNNLQ